MLVVVETPVELFELRFTSVEQENRFGSTRFEALVRIERFKERLTHCTEIWIACEDWDAFVARLAPGRTEEAVLFDLSKEWRLTVGNRDADKHLELAVKQWHSGAGALSVAFTSTLTDEQLGQLIRAFTTWSRWWAG